MFGLSKKLAASMAELLIILAIVGILSTLYRKTINEDAIAVKAGYKTAVNDLIAFGATETEDYTRNLSRGSICERFSRMVNTVGEVNCEASIYPLIPNLTTTSGMRFFGLEQVFQQHNDGSNESSVFIQVDLDGLMGKNRFEEDIFPIELLQNGRIRPSGSSGRFANNVARDAELYAINVSYVPANATTRDDFQTIANRVSYAEAQCLSGNIFPYRDAHWPNELQFCVEDAELREALDLPTAAREDFVRTYRRAQALNNNNDNICSGIYNAGGIAAGQPALVDVGETRCEYCYKIAYIQDYCANPEQIYVNPNADPLVKLTDAAGEEICPDAILNATDTAGNLLSEGLCSTPQWAEVSR